MSCCAYEHAILSFTIKVLGFSSFSEYTMVAQKIGKGKLHDYKQWYDKDEDIIHVEETRNMITVLPRKIEILWWTLLSSM